MVSWLVTIGGVDVSASIVRSSVRITSTGWRGVSTAQFRVQDLASAINPALESEVLILASGTRVFGGILRSIDPLVVARTKRSFDLVCQDYSSLLHDDVAWGADARRRASETDKVRITWLVNRWGSKGITVGTEVQAVESDLEPMDLRGKTLAECLDLICEETGASWYVDQFKKLHYFRSESTPEAPWDFTDSNPNGTTTLPYWGLRLPQESAGLVNAVWVRGTGISGWRTDTASIALYGRREGSITAPWVKRQRQLERRGDSYLRVHAWPEQAGSFQTWAADGLRAGMRFQLTSGPLGLVAANFRTSEVTQRIDAADGRGIFEVSFGGRARPDFGRTIGDVVDVGESGNVGVIDGLDRSTAIASAGPNLVVNSSAERAGVGWTVGSGWTLGHTHPHARHGEKTFRAVATASTPGELVLTGAILVDRDIDHRFSVHSWMTGRTAGEGRILVREFDSGGSLLTETVVASVTADEPGWERHVLRLGDVDTDEGPAFHASTASVRLVAKGVGSCTYTWDLDAWQVEASEDVSNYAPAWGELAEGSIAVVDFAPDIRPVGLVASLPTLPDPKWPVGSVVSLISDGKMYRNVGGSWTSAIAALDVAGQIVAAQIADGAVIAAKIASGAVQTSNFASGIRPVGIGAALPSLPSASWPSGATFALTTDGKLYRSTGSAWTAAVPTTDLSGTITTAQIADAAVTLAKFAAGTRPVGVVSSLPALPDAAYPDGAVVVLTTDDKLYRSTGSTWTAAVPAADITGTLSTSQISDGALTVAKFASGLRPVQILTGALPALPSGTYPEGATVYRTDDDKLYRSTGSAWTAAVPTTDLTGTITSAQIADAAVTTAKFAAGIRPVAIVGALPTLPDATDWPQGATVVLTTDNKVYRSTGSTWVATVPAADVTGTLTGAQIANDAITTSKLADNAVTVSELADNAVSSAKLVDGAVTSAKLGAGAVTTTAFASGIRPVQVVASLPALPNAAYPEGAVVVLTTDDKLYRSTGAAWTASVPTVDLTGTIATGQIADDAVTSAKIGPAAVDTTALADAAVALAKIADNAVSTAKIADSAILAAKLATDAVTNAKIAADAVTTAKIAAGAVTSAEIGALAVTTAKIAAGAVTASELAAGAVTLPKFAAGIRPVGIVSSLPALPDATNYPEGSTVVLTTDDKLYRSTGSTWVSAVPTADLTGQITTTQITDDAVTTAKVAANAITATEIATDAITSGKILAGAITAAKIAAGAVSATEIAAGAISADKLVVGLNGAQNQLRNGGFYDGLTYWNVATNGSWTATMRAASDASWTLRDGDVAGWTAGGTLYGSTAQLYTNVNLGWGAIWQDVPAVQGEYLSLSALLGNHRATSATIEIRFFDAASTLLSSVTAAWVSGAGGAIYSNWDYVHIDGAQAPANTRFARVWIQASTPWTSGTDTYLFIDQVMLTRSRAAIPYAPLKGTLISDGTITTNNLAAGAVTATEIAAGAVTTSKIAAGAVTATEIAASTITAAKIASDTITGSQIAANAITSSELAAGAVVAGKIAAGTIVAGDIASGAVTTAKIAAGAVTAAEIAAGAITTEKLTVGSLGASAVLNGGFEDVQGADPTRPAAWWQAGGGNWVGSPSWETTTDALTGSRALAVTLNAATDIATVYTWGYPIPVAAGEQWYVSVWAKGSAAVTGSGARLAIWYYGPTGIYLSSNTTAMAHGTSFGKLETVVTIPAGAAQMRIGVQASGPSMTGSPSFPHTTTFDDVVARKVIVSAEIGAGSVTTTKIAAGAVTANEIAANAVTAAKIAANTITATQIASDTITGGQIAAGAIAASELAAGAVTAAKLLVPASRGAALNADPMTADATAWTTQNGSNWEIATVTDGKVGNTVLRSNGAAGNAWLYETAKVDLDPAKTYRLRAWVRRKTGDRLVYLIARFADSAGAVVTSPSTGWSAGTHLYWGLVAANTTTLPADSVWRECVFTFGPNGTGVTPTTAKTVQIGAILNYTGGTTDGVVEVQDLRIEEVLPGTLIQDGVISTDKLVAGAVTTSKIVAGAVTATEISAGAVTTAKIAAGAVTATEILAGAVTTPKLAAGAVTANEIGANAVTTAKIAAGAVTATQIAADTITAGQIAAGAIGATEIAADAVTTAKIAAGAVTATEIAAGTITATQIAGDTITGAQIAANAIAAGELAANAVTTGKIAAGAITAAQIAAGAITAAQLAVTDLTNLAENPGFEYGDINWAKGAGMTIVSDGNARTGSWAMKHTGGTGALRNSFIVPVEVGDDFRAEAWIKTGTTGTGYVRICRLNASQVEIGTTMGNVIPAGTSTYTLSAVNLTIASGTYFIRVEVVADDTGGTASYADDIRLLRRANGSLIVDGSIVAAKIAAGTITATQIAGDTITASQIAANAISASELATNAVTTGKIAAGTVTATELAAGSVTTEKMTVGNWAINAIPNGGFEDVQAADATKPAQWYLASNTINGGGWGTATSGQATGSRCLTLTLPGATATAAVATLPDIPVVEGEQWYMSALFKGSTAGGTTNGAQMYAHFYNAAGTYLSSASAGFPFTTGWVRRGHLVTVPSTAVKMKVGPWANGTVMTASPPTYPFTGYVDDYQAQKMVVSAVIADGAITTTKVAAGAVTANEIAANAVTAGKIAADAVTAGTVAAGAIRTRDLLVTGAGSALNADPNTQDATAWTTQSGTNWAIATVTDGRMGSSVLASTGGTGTAWVYATARVPVTDGKVYRLHAWVRRKTGDRGFYLGVRFTDQAGTVVTSGATGWDGIFAPACWAVNGWQLPELPADSVWREVAFTFGGSGATLPTGAKFAQVTTVVNGNGVGTTDGVIEVQDLRLEEMIPASLIVEGAITADKIAAGAITTDRLGAGIIVLGTTTDRATPDGLQVQDQDGNVLASWDETGLLLYETPGATDPATASYLAMTGEGIVLVSGGQAIGSITPDGIDASGLRSGIAPGGNNLIPNSGFELTPLGQIRTTVVDTAAADWTGNRVGTLDNLQEAANALAFASGGTAW